MAIRDAILARVARRTQQEVSSVFGDLLLRELSRLDHRVCAESARAPEGRIFVDVWHAAVFAACVIDPDTNEPAFTADEVLLFGNRDEVWAEVARIANVALALSEVGPDSLKSGDPPADVG